MQRISSFLLLALLMIGLSTNAMAQDHFEGRITYSAYQISNDGRPQSDGDQLNLFITPDRLLINDLDSYKVMGNLRSNGILIRLDQRDFVILSDDDVALQITKDDIDDMMAMMKGFASWSGDSDKQQPQMPETNIERTGRKKEISGYDCYEIVVTDPEKPDEKTNLWMTDDLNVNWGMLTEAWGSGSNSFFPNGIPMNDLLQNGALPLRVEHYKEGHMSDMMEVNTVKKSKVARAMVQIPQGVEVLGFRDYIMRQMQQQ